MAGEERIGVGAMAAQVAAEIAARGCIDYDAMAGSIQIEDIARDPSNRVILRRLRANDPRMERVDIGGERGYAPETAFDLGWLGYFIGKSWVLRELNFWRFLGEVDADYVRDLCEGVNRNTSIEKIGFIKIVYPMKGNFFKLMRPFFENNRKLASVTVAECVFGDEGCARELATTLASCCSTKSLKNLIMSENLQGAIMRGGRAAPGSDLVRGGFVAPGSENGFNIGGGPMMDVKLLGEGLGGHNQLEVLRLNSLNIGAVQCRALATLLRSKLFNLRELGLRNNDINDEGLELVVGALAYNGLRVLDLTGNRQITSGGWGKLAGLLEGEGSNLEALFLNRNNVDDNAVINFSDSLASNRQLRYLYLDTSDITTRGWDAVLKVLCDTSGVSETFLSNHVLERFGLDGTLRHADIPPDVKYLLELNSSDAENKKGVALDKILTHHRYFDMKPLLKWDLKLLPQAMGWMERAAAKRISKNDATYEELTGRIKLSALYEFVRGMPEQVETAPRKMIRPRPSLANASPMVMAAIAVAIAAVATGLFEVRRGLIFRQ